MFWSARCADEAVEEGREALTIRYAGFFRRLVGVDRGHRDGVHAGLEGRGGGLLLRQSAREPFE